MYIEQLSKEPGGSVVNQVIWLNLWYVRRWIFCVFFSLGYSGADMKNLCSEAALGPIRSLPFQEIENISEDEVGYSYWIKIVL